MYSNIIDGLDERQKEAVLSNASRILVVAPPGSGKTRVLVCRFARFLLDGVSPDGILAVTFTNRAAAEMRKRVGELASSGTAQPNIGTFHSFCLKFLKKGRPGFLLYGRAETAGLLREMGVRNSDKAADMISSAKNRSTLLEGDDLEVFNLYQGEMKKRGALDLDDLILETLNALKAPDAIHGALFSHVMVDAFQDINRPQSSLIRLLAGPHRGEAAGPSTSLFAIGDPDQAIYGFRGSDVKCFLDFGRDYAGAEVIRLLCNYRSMENIVKASGALIGRGRDGRGTHTKCGSDSAISGKGAISVIRVNDERAEAEFIVREIEALMGGLSSLTVTGGQPDARFSDFAVLYRTNRQAEALADAFMRSPIPYHVAGPPAPCLKDFIARLRGHAPEAGVELRDLVKPEAVIMGIDDGLLAILLDKAEGLHGPDIGAFLAEMSLLEPSDNLDIKADRVNLMTLHASKGLEFRTVFIAGVEEGLIPLTKSGMEADLEEERRLFYVGITRAKERLYILSAEKRRMRGEIQERRPSPMLKDIPGEFFAEKVVEKKKTARRPRQKGLFE
ncbi:MAG: ATP-dependent helicase [Deltaproteobacteria bacterium]|nr:ATP-dependent helicase [Deltaproteobacteria bacterium]